MSPLIFLIVLDWVTRTAYSTKHRGIQWTFSKKLEDLGFADDLCLLAHRLQDIQDKTEALQTTAKQVGLKINADKTKLMKVNTKQAGNVSIEGKNIEEVENFTYLGSVTSPTGGTEKDIPSRIKKAQQAFAILKPVWKSKTLTPRTKLRLYNSNVFTIQ